jgi:hypothetical protein
MSDQAWKLLVRRDRGQVIVVQSVIVVLVLVIVVLKLVALLVLILVLVVVLVWGIVIIVRLFGIVFDRPFSPLILILNRGVDLGLGVGKDRGSHRITTTADSFRGWFDVV